MCHFLFIVGSRRSLGCKARNNDVIHRTSLIQVLILGTDLSENWVKSASRSHILRPLRAAFAEYTGPIPFFVVPRLGGWGKKIQEALTRDLSLQHFFCVQVQHVIRPHPDPVTLVSLCRRVSVSNMFKSFWLRCVTSRVIEVTIIFNNITVSVSLNTH